MSIWLEIHCDIRTGGNRPDNLLRSVCHSNSNDNPAGMARNRSSIHSVLSYISDEAMKAGWRFHRGRWICPGCRKYGGTSRAKKES